LVAGITTIKTVEMEQAITEEDKEVRRRTRVMRDDVK
jgi:hypothetical protein